jgi:putative heme-binding domain-containing protein
MNKRKILILTAFLGLSLIIGIGCKVHKAMQRSMVIATFTNAPDSIVMDESDDSLYSGILFNQNIRSTTARTPEEERAGFKLPPGFEITLFASEPEIGKPINIAFDAKGRMWVTQSFEYPFPAVAPRKGRDRLTILEDTNHDGRADKFTQVSDTLNIPIGVLPLNDGAIVYSIPNIYRYTDDGNGGYTSHKMFGPFGHKDTHGMVNNMLRGYNGWVDVDHGFTNLSTISGTDGHTISMASGNTFRFKIDGSRVEQTTFGRVNPFGLAYDQKGYLYGSDCTSNPLYQLVRGGDYPAFGAGPASNIAFAPIMKYGYTTEATALAGLNYYDDTIFPAQYRHKLFMGDVVACRIYIYPWVTHGTTPVCKKDPDNFMKSKDPWFRPVDVVQGPDGALYIADFYNAIIGHYEVPLDDPRRDRVRGRIWRITYKGKTNAPMDWTAATINQLLDALNKPSMPVRFTAADQLADRIGAPAIEPLKALLKNKQTPPLQYIHALWVLYRLNALDDKMLKKAANSPEPLIRLHAMRILLEQEPDQLNYPLLLKGLKDEDPDIQRAALDVMSHYPTMQSLKAVLAQRPTIPFYDSVMTYTSQLCLRHLLLNRDLMKQTAAMQWKEPDARNIAEVLVDVPYPEAAIYLNDYIKQYGLPKNVYFSTPKSVGEGIYNRIAQFIPYGQIHDVVNDARTKATGIEAQYEIFRGVKSGIASRGETDPPELIEWGSSIAPAMLDKYPATIKTNMFVSIYQGFAIGLAGEYHIKAMEPQLKRFLQPGSMADLDTKTNALRSLLQIDPAKNAEYAGDLFQDPATPLDFKVRVATALGDLTGSNGSSVNGVLAKVNKVLAQVKNAPPDLQSAIVISLAGSPEGKDLIFRRVREGEIFSRVLVEPKASERILLNISPKQKKEYDALVANVEPVNTERDKEIFQRMMSWNANKNSLPPLDSCRAMFMNTCSPCHSVDNQGGNIGPALDGVSKWGPGNLLTKMMDPNRNISEAFRNYTIKLKDGKILSGLYRRDEGEVIIFADNTGHEFSVSKSDIAEQTASKYTLMPDDFRYRLTMKQSDEIVNFLINHK